MQFWRELWSWLSGPKPKPDRRDEWRGQKLTPAPQPTARPRRYKPRPPRTLCESCGHLPPSRQGSPYLCDVCEPIKRKEFSRCLEIANESIEIARKSKNPETRLSRLWLTVEMIDRSSDGYRWGLMTGHATPQSERKRILETAESVAAEYAAQLTEQAREKAAGAASVKGRVQAYERALAKLKKAKEAGPQMPILDDAIEQLQAERDQLT